MNKRMGRSQYSHAVRNLRTMACLLGLGVTASSWAGNPVDAPTAPTIGPLPARTPVQMRPSPGGWRPAAPGNPNPQVTHPPVPLQPKPSDRAMSMATPPVGANNWIGSRNAAYSSLGLEATLPTRVYAKMIAPTGTRVVFFSGPANELPYTLPVTLGLRSLHLYVFALENIPEASGQRFYGTLEVVLGPRLPPDADGAELALPIRFTEEDTLALVRERMLTKYIVLEKPESALAAPSDSNETVRYEASLDDDAVQMAREIGRVVVIVRMGTRVPTKSEIAGLPADGSLFLPNQMTAAQGSGTQPYAEFRAGTILPVAYCHACSSGRSVPAAHGRATPRPGYQAPMGPRGMQGTPGCVPPATGLVSGGPDYRQLWDGLKRVPLDEFLCDGGDRGLKANLTTHGQILNIDPEDTIAVYGSKNGGRKIAESNRVCVYAPRFAEVRVLQALEAFDTRLTVDHVERDRMVEMKQQVERRGEKRTYSNLQVARGRKRASGLIGEMWAGNYSELRVLRGYEQGIGWAAGTGAVKLEQLAMLVEPALLERIAYAQVLTVEQYPQLLGMTEGIGEVSVVWKTSQISKVEERPRHPAKVKLEKIASVPAAKIGEEVTFAIKFTNIGEEAVTSIVVVDSLHQRLEYVPNSAEGPKDAVFSIEDNTAGSSVLRWEIQSPLKSGESGLVRFRAVVR